eukprot:6150630-Pleurochrysis_carterae.AAC.1
MMRARNAVKEANMLLHPDPKPARQIVRARPLPPPFDIVCSPSAAEIPSAARLVPNVGGGW